MLKSLRSSYNEILALAVLDLFPGVILGESKLTETQFSYRFHFTQPEHPELLLLVEEKMRALIKSHLRIECIEMSAKNAEAYFDHYEQPFKADLVAESNEILLPLIRIGKFCDLMISLPYLENLSESFFQLLEAHSVKENDILWIEIIGTVFFSKAELKDFVKHRKKCLKEKAWKSAELLELIYYAGQTPVLLPNGVRLMRNLEKFWRSQVQTQDSMVEIATVEEDSYSVVAQHLKKDIAVWSAKNEEKFGPADFCIKFPSFNQLIPQCISSLQFIQQTFTMLELSGKWVLCTKNPGTIHVKQWEHEVNVLTQALEACGFSYTIDQDSCTTIHPSVEIRISDTLGEVWKGPFLVLSCGEKNKQLNSKKHTQSEAFIAYSLLGPVKRLIAILAECKVGKWLNVGES